MSKINFRLHLTASLALAFTTQGAWSLAQDPVASASETLALPAVQAPLEKATTQPSADGLNHHQWIHLASDGSFWGTLGTPAGENQIKQSGIELALVQNGQRVAWVTTAEDGSFRFSDIKPGVYALVAQNPSTLAVMSLTILDSSAGKHLPSGIQIRSLTPATDRVVSLIRSGSIPRNTGVEQFDKDPVGEGRKFWNSGRIAIDENGGVRGRVSVPGGGRDLSGTQIYLTHAGNEVAKTRADRDGNYRFDNIPPGNYGFVASGPAGIAALGFVAVGKSVDDSGTSTSIAQDGRKFVHASVQQDAVPALNVELASCDCLGASMVAQAEIPFEETCCPLPMSGCCGVAGGNSGGGGGGGGGGIGGGFGGGLLPLALIGGLTAVGLAVANDDDDKSQVIVSPVVP